MELSVETGKKGKMNEKSKNILRSMCLCNKDISANVHTDVIFRFEIRPGSFDPLGMCR